MRRKLAPAATVLALAVGVAAFAPGSAGAGPGGCRRTGVHATSFHLLVAGTATNGLAVKFYNYDFGSPTCARANNVEWPVDLLFYNNASINAVESGLSNFFPYGSPFASSEYARINPGGRYHWVSNGGRKTAMESKGSSDEHYRVYAYRGRTYDINGLGFFVIGTMHKDFNEFAGTPGASYGDSEDAEADLAADARSLSGVNGWQVFQNNYDMRNGQYGQEGNHIWQNDGLATMIRMP